MRYFLNLFLLIGLTFWGLVTYATEYKSIKMISIPLTNEKPVIDGQLNESMWEDALSLSDFTLTSGNIGDPASEKTTCLITADEKHLYIAFKCMESDMPNIKAGNKIWDDTDILYDDRVSILLDVDHDHRNYYELVVNTQGVQMDRSGFLRYPNTRSSDWDIGWNCFWRARTRIEKDNWVAEIMVDITSLGLESIEPGMTWGFNVARVRQPAIQIGDEWSHRKAEFPSEYSAWKPVNDGLWETISNFYEPIQFGDMVFDNPKFMVQGLAFKCAKFNWGDVFTPSHFGWNPLQIHLGNIQDPDREIKVQLSVEGQYSGSWSSEMVVKCKPGIPVETSYFIPENRENKLIIRLSDPVSKKLLYQTSYVLTIPPFIDFNLEPLYTRSPGIVRPMQFRLVTDSITRNRNELNIALSNDESGEIISEVYIKDLLKSDQFTPIFNIDNIRILPGGVYSLNCSLIDKNTKKIIAEFSQPFSKFNLEKPKEFGAMEGEYDFGGIKDDAIRIQYPNGSEFVFWRAANYGPWWDLDQAALNFEHLECWGGNTQACCEIMQDREQRYTQVEIIENSPARVVVHWRYALADAHYKIHMNEWGDEYYRFYPDGIVIREINLWANSDKKHEFFEAIPVKPPGVGNLQLYEKPMASLKSLNGDGYSTDEFWKEDMDFYHQFLDSSKDFVFEFNMKDRLHPFVVFSLRHDLMPGVKPKYIDLCSPNRSIIKGDHRGHWPTSLYPIDGYNAIGNDRPHHGNIGSIKAEVDPSNNPNKWLIMLGLTESESDMQYLHGRSWLEPATCKSLTGGVRVTGYNPSERAYDIKIDVDQNFIVEIDPNRGKMVNPVFILTGQKSDLNYVKYGNKKINPENIQIGKTGDNKTIVFVNITLDKKAKFSFHL